MWMFYVTNQAKLNWGMGLASWSTVGLFSLFKLWKWNHTSAEYSEDYIHLLFTKNCKQSAKDKDLVKLTDICVCIGIKIALIAYLFLLTIREGQYTNPDYNAIIQCNSKLY